MVSLEDIFVFMKQEKAARAKEREEDMKMIKETISKLVNDELLAIVEPMSKRQKKVEDDQKLLQDKFKELLDTVTDLRKKLSVDDPPLGSKDQRGKANGNCTVILDAKPSELKEIVSVARRTIGLQCIYPEDVQRQTRLYGAKDETEARILAVKEFLKCEMKVSGEVFDEMHVEQIFPPANENWNKLYIKFASESSVHTLYKYTRHLRSNQRLVPYIPKQFYPRYKAMESLAYTLRHGEIKYRTRVKMGISDLVLYKRKPNESSWIAVPPPPDIPQVILTEHTIDQPLSPAPGRSDRRFSRDSTSTHQSTKPSSPVQLNLRPNSAFALSSKSVSQK